MSVNLGTGPLLRTFLNAMLSTEYSKILNFSCNFFDSLINSKVLLKVHKRENFLGSDFEICTFS